MGGNHSDAEEALSQATLKAWNKLPKYAGKITNLRAWLTRLTHNLCVDIHRQRQRSSLGVESIEEMRGGDGEAVASDIATPESEVLSDELKMYINYAINALPAKLRETFVLRYYEEISDSDIAKKLGISNSNVRKRIQNARQILQQHLQKYLAGENHHNLENIPNLLASKQAIAKISKVSHSLATQKNIAEKISYQVIASCLATTTHNFYKSLNLLGWR